MVQRHEWLSLAQKVPVGQSVIKERFMSECIEHSQTGNRRLYGYTSYKGVKTLMHRIVYCRTHGLDLEQIRGLVVRHTCDNRRCVHPDHLVIGTHQDNANDMVQRGRSARGEKHGSAVLTLEDLKYIKSIVVPKCKVNGYAAIGRRYGVTGEAVSAAVRGINWGILEGT